MRTPTFAEPALSNTRIVRAGPILNGDAFGPVQLAVADAAQARGAVRALAKAGVDFIKIQAIQGATRLPAEYLRLRDAGTTEEGKRADFVLLSALPRCRELIALMAGGDSLGYRTTVSE